MNTWRFSAFDSWFFRESRPFDAIGGSELGSVFPPSPATMAGAIRSVIGNKNEVDWRNYPDGYSKLKERIGDSGSLGNMTIKGVFLSRKNPDNGNWERLYPVPAHLVATYEKGKIKQLHFLQVGKPVHCDLGEMVRLAVAPDQVKGIKPLEDYWLTASGLAKVLNGTTDLLVKNDKNETYDLIHSDNLFKNDSRLGIARNNFNHTVVQGNLYQTQHVRPKAGVAIEADVDGLIASDYPESGIVRLGGEGRGAAFEVFGANKPLAGFDYAAAQPPGIMLVLMTAMHVPQKKGDNYVPLPSFSQSEENGQTVWTGNINGITLTLHCAVIGKALREGGWDLQNKQPRPVRSLIPAGSVFFCTATDSQQALKALHWAQLDNGDLLDKASGRGIITAAPWLTNK